MRPFASSSRRLLDFSSPSATFAATARTPLCQLVMIVNTTAPNSRGIHPPSGSLRRLAAKKATSNARKPPAIKSASGLGQCQIPRMALYSRMVVISMVVDTAVP
jgi:hypothetical protein